MGKLEDLDRSMSQPPGHPALRRARAATTAVFMLHALTFASWTPHIPLVKERLGLSAGALGVALFGAALGSVMAMLAAGAATARWGSRRLAGVATILLGATGIGVPFAVNVPTLLLALAAWGASYGALGVAMNSQAVAVDHAYGRPVLAAFHGFWSLGALAGTGLGIAAVHRGVGLAAQMAVLGVVLVVAAVVTSGWMLTGGTPAAAQRLAPVLRDRRILKLGAVIAAGLLCEGAAADWAAVYLRDHVGTSGATAGVGYAAFVTVMLVGRFVGDRLIRAFSGPTLVRGLAASAAAILASALAVGGVTATVIGFAALGAGLSVIVPTVYRSASHLAGIASGQSVAAISMMGWFGFLVGPPLIGGLAELVGLRGALVALPVLLLSIAGSARLLRTR